MTNNKDDSFKNVPEEYILDSFYMDPDVEIVVLDPAIYNGKVDDDALIMCKAELKNGEKFLKGLTEEEYMSAFEKYQQLIELFGGEDE